MTVYGYKQEPLKADYRLFCLLCYYKAKTEMFDRILTDKRDSNDPTSAFITPAERPYSDLYSHNLYGRIVRFAIKLGIWDDLEWEMLEKERTMISAQKWIDMYEYLDETGELEFIKKK